MQPECETENYVRNLKWIINLWQLWKRLNSSDILIYLILNTCHSQTPDWVCADPIIPHRWFPERKCNTQWMPGTSLRQAPRSGLLHRLPAHHCLTATLVQAKRGKRKQPLKFPKTNFRKGNRKRSLWMLPQARMLSCQGSASLQAL